MSKNIFIKNYIILFFFGSLFGISINNYYTFENNSHGYQLIEYRLIKENIYSEIYIFKQPFKYDEISGVAFKDSQLIESSNSLNLNNEIFFDLNPGFSSSGKKFSFKPYFDISSLISIENTQLYINVEFDKRFINDSHFHGDKQSILTGYVRDSYLESKFGNLEIFAGRLSRNYGIINEYSTIFSNNSYAFDHYGISLTGDKTTFSFYLSRLNDLDNSVDSQGITIALDSMATSKRYFSFQHLGIKFTEKLQIGFSQSIIYGGPDQTLEGPYINPINFYYSDQRNSGIQMNGFWQFLLAYHISNNNIFYIDLLIDDFIINNENPHERENYPDRLGLIVKYSSADLIMKHSLSSFVYTKISNDTYTSFRNYENYFYQLKGIGFPYNSYESIKYTFTKFSEKPLIYNLLINLNRKGNSNLFTTFDGEKENFPINPIVYNVDMSISFSSVLLRKIRIFYEVSYKLESLEANFDNYVETNNHGVRIIYEL